MRIGEVASQAGVSVRSLRYYEERGLLSSERTPGGQRDYGEEAVERVRLLQSLYAVGMSSQMIADVVIPCVDHPNADTQGAAWARMVEERDRLRASIAELCRTEAALDRMIAEHAEHCTAPPPGTGGTEPGATGR